MAMLMVLVFAEELWWSSWDCPFVWMAIVQPVRLCVHLPAPALHTISSGCWKSQHNRWATITKAQHSLHRSVATLNHLPTVIYILPSCILLPSVSPVNDALAPRHPQISKKENQMYKPLPSISPCSTSDPPVASSGALNMESALWLVLNIPTKQAAAHVCPLTRFQQFVLQFVEPHGPTFTPVHIWECLAPTALLPVHQLSFWDNLWSAL